MLLSFWPSGSSDGGALVFLFQVRDCSVPEIEKGASSLLFDVVRRNSSTPDAVVCFQFIIAYCLRLDFFLGRGGACYLMLFGERHQ